MINPHIEFALSKRDKEQVIIDNKYIYNFYKLLKNDIKSYKCTYYKKSKCPSYIKLNKDKNIIEYLIIITILFQIKKNLKLERKQQQKKKYQVEKIRFKSKVKIYIRIVLKIVV